MMTAGSKEWLWKKNEGISMNNGKKYQGKQFLEFKYPNVQKYLLLNIRKRNDTMKINEEKLQERYHLYSNFNLEQVKEVFYSKKKLTDWPNIKSLTKINKRRQQINGSYNWNAQKISEYYEKVKKSQRLDMNLLMNKFFDSQKQLLFIKFMELSKYSEILVKSKIKFNNNNKWQQLMINYQIKMQDRTMKSSQSDDSLNKKRETLQ